MVVLQQQSPTKPRAVVGVHVQADSLMKAGAGGIAEEADKNPQQPSSYMPTTAISDDNILFEGVLGDYELGELQFNDDPNVMRTRMHMHMHMHIQT